MPIQPLPSPLPTTDAERDRVIAEKFVEVSTKLALSGLTLAFVLPLDVNGKPKLVSDGKKRDEQMWKALQAARTAIKTRDPSAVIPELPDIKSLRDPARDQKLIPCLEACIAWVNKQEQPPPTPTPVPADPITVKLIAPTTVMGGAGLTTQITATTTGPVTAVTFGFESGPNGQKDLSVVPLNPATPNRFDFPFFLSPMWTPTGQYVLFARAVGANGETVIATAPVLVTSSAPAPTPVPVPTPTPVPVPSDAISTILALLGPTLSVTQTKALGGVFAAYEDLWNSMTPNGLRPLLPDPSTDTWENNYYDRGALWYARYARTLDSVFLQRAHSITLAYRQNYLAPNGYKAVAHWAFPRGLELHYRLTGDVESRQAVAGMYVNTLKGFTMPLWGPKADLENTQSAYMENRIQARVLHAALSAYRMSATYTGEWGTIGPAEWPTELKKILNQILSTQNPDGSYSWVQISGGQENFMVGILNDVLIEYERDFEADTRIFPCIERANEYLWTTQWREADQAFQYFSREDDAPGQENTGGTTPSGDLNGLFIASFGWLYNRTGDVKWKERGDKIMAGLVAPRWASNYTGSKQFTQAFVESHRYLGWR